MTKTRTLFQSTDIQDIEKKCLESCFSSLGGDKLLLLGNHRTLENLPVHRLLGFNLSADKFSPLSASPMIQMRYIQSSYDALPLRNNTLDAVVLPYLLEYCENPCGVLNDLYRCLTGEGKLFLFGFQRLHPWCWFNTPPPLHYLSYFTIKYFLDQAGYSIKYAKHVHYGAIYFIEAQKHLQTLTPIRSEWSSAPAGLEKIWGSLNEGKT